MMPHQTKRLWCKTCKKMVTAYRDFAYWWATCGHDNETNPNIYGGGLLVDKNTKQE